MTVMPPGQGSDPAVAAPTQPGPATRQPPQVDRASRFTALAEQAEQVSTRYADEAEKLRARADLWGKALSTAMTAAVGWVTWTKATDIFPKPHSNWSFVLAIVSMVSMCVAVLVIWFWFNRQTRPLAMSLDIGAMRRDWPRTISRRDATAVAQIYAELGHTNRMDEHEAARAAEQHAEGSGRRHTADATAAIASNLIRQYADIAVDKEAAAEAGTVPIGWSSPRPVAPSRWRPDRRSHSPT